MMKKLVIEFGDAVRVYYKNQEILKLIFDVNVAKEEIELITLEKGENIAIEKGITDHRFDTE